MATFFEKLNKAKEEIRLDPTSKNAMRGRLLRHIEAMEAVRGWEVLRHDTQRSFVMNIVKPMPIMGAMMVVALVGGGTSLAAEGSLPGDFLYPIKVHVNEEMRAALSFTSKVKADWEVSRAERRLAETAALASEGKLDAKVAAELENSFNAHAEEVKSRIEELKKDDVKNAADVASNFEASLAAHKHILTEVETRNSSTASVGVRLVEAKVGAALRTIMRVREGLEDEISSEDQSEKNHSKEEIKTAAEAKLAGATAAIAGVHTYVKNHTTQLGTDALAKTEAQLSAAQDFIAKGNEQLHAEAYGRAFSLGNHALRTAEWARVLAEAQIKLKLNVLENVTIEIPRSASSAEEKNEDERKIENKETDDRSSVEIKERIKGQEGNTHVRRRGEIELKLGL